MNQFTPLMLLILSAEGDLLSAPVDILFWGFYCLYCFFSSSVNVVIIYLISFLFKHCSTFHILRTICCSANLFIRFVFSKVSSGYVWFSSMHNQNQIACVDMIFCLYVGVSVLKSYTHILIIYFRLIDIIYYYLYIANNYFIFGKWRSSDNQAL